MAQMSDTSIDTTVDEHATPEAVVVEQPKVEPTTVPMADIEAAATAQGWSADKGDLGPLEFLQNGRVYRDRMFDEIKDLRKENEKVYGLVAEGFDRQAQKEHANEVRTLQQQIDDAEAEGDATKVRSLMQQMPAAPEKTPPQQDNPERTFFENWQKDESWYNTDAEMTKTMNGFLQAETITDGGRVIPSQQVPRAMEQIKKVYPNKFKPATNPNEDRGADVEKGAKPKKVKAAGLTRADLDEDEAKHFDAFVKGGAKPESLLKSIQRRRDNRG